MSQPCVDTRDAAAELRCLCGSLLARWVPEGLELKCRRCKRPFIVPFPEGMRIGSIPPSRRKR